MSNSGVLTESQTDYRNKDKVNGPNILSNNYYYEVSSQKFRQIKIITWNFVVISIRIVYLKTHNCEQIINIWQEYFI